MSGTGQFIRKCSLIVYGATSFGAEPQSQTVPGLDLSQFRIQFSVSAMDVDEPPTARIRVLNLADSTAKMVQNEFQNVTLQAGYENGNFGVIFQGTIMRSRRGRLSNIDSFVDIMASNFDAVYNFGVISKTAKAGTTLQDRVNLVKQGVADSPAAQGSPNALPAGMQYGSIPNSFGTGGTLPRGKVMFGLARKYLTQLADSGLSTWSVGPDGKVYIRQLDAYPQGEAVVLTAATGLIKVPEATQQGIEITALLNPLIQTGTALKLDNSEINTTQNRGALGSVFPSFSSPPEFFANTSDDGIYRALVVEHEGDTRGRGEDWMTKIIALATDQSSQSVQPYGWQGVT